MSVPFSDWTQAEEDEFDSQHIDDIMLLQEKYRQRRAEDEAEAEAEAKNSSLLEEEEAEEPYYSELLKELLEEKKKKASCKDVLKGSSKEKTGLSENDKAKPDICSKQSEGKRVRQKKI